MAKYTKHVAPKQYAGEAYITITDKLGRKVGEKLKNVVVTERTHVGLELEQDDIFTQLTYKSTLGKDAHKGDQVKKAKTMYDNIYIQEISQQVDGRAKREKVVNNAKQKEARIIANEMGLTQKQIRQINKIRKKLNK